MNFTAISFLHYLLLLLPLIVKVAVAQPTQGVNNYIYNVGGGSGTVSIFGRDNTAIGVNSGSGLGDYSGSYNSFFGSLAGNSTTTGRQNTFLGSLAGVSNTNAFGNTFVGYKAGFNTTIGQFNTFIGVQSGLNNTTGSSNFILGTNAGLANTTGTGNFFMGDNAAGFNTTGSFNLYIGANVANGTDVNGDNNTAVGYESGKGNQLGINNTFLGFRADAGAGSLSNATAIGNNARVNISNAVVLGNGANVGIGNSAPSAKLHITTSIANTSGLRLENLTNLSPATATNQYKFLSVDGSGNVILASLNSTTRVGVTDSFWQRSGRYLQSSEETAVVIGGPTNATPEGYSLFVGKGILTEKVKVAVKNTKEWSDRVFEAGYNLKRLEQVEQHIKQTGHLPGVPGAAEVVEQGIDVAKMDAKLLEKIEELTLYSIQLEKASKAQQAEIDELKRVVKLLTDKK